MNNSNLAQPAAPVPKPQVNPASGGGLYNSPLQSGQQTTLNGTMDATGNPQTVAQPNIGDYTKMPVSAGMTGQQAILSRLEPTFVQQRQARQQELANQGVAQGTEAYRNMMTEASQGENDARIQAALQGLNYDFNADKLKAEVEMNAQNANTAKTNADKSLYADIGGKLVGSDIGQNLIGKGVDAATGYVKGLFGNNSPNTLPENTQNSSLPKSQQGPTNANAASLGSTAVPAAAAAYNAATAAPLGSSIVEEGIGNGLFAATTPAATAAAGGAAGGAYGSLAGMAPYEITGAAANGAIGGGAAASGAASTGGALGMNLATLGPIGGAALLAMALKKIADVDRSRGSGTTDPYAGFFTDMGYGGLQPNGDPLSQEWQAGVGAVDPNSGLKWESNGGRTTYYNHDGTVAYVIYPSNPNMVYGPDGKTPYIPG